MSKGQQNQTFDANKNLAGTSEANASAALTGTNTDLSGANTELSGANTAYNNLLPTGGFNPGQLSTLEGAETSNLGGLDPTALSGLSSQYQDLISSGGISDATQAAMQRQAVSGVSSLYGTLSDQQRRRLSATGGQGGGGETAQLARQLSSAEANAVTGVNADIGQLRQQGTEAGLAGVSNLTAAQAAAQNAAAQTFSGTQSNVASGALGAAGGLTNVAGGLTNVAGLQGGLYNSALNAQLGALGGQANIANAQKGPFGNLLSGVGALSGLAGSTGSLLTGIGNL